MLDVLAPFAVVGHLDNRVRIIAVILTAILLGIVLELVRRRRLVERYALLWMTVALALLVLAVWNEPLRLASNAAGVDVPANALFIAAFAVAFLLLLHFSVITTRLSEETKILAQEVARLDAEARAARDARVNGERARNPAGRPSATGAAGLEPPSPRKEPHLGSRASTSDQ